MNFKFIEKEIAYDGSQLKSLFGYLDHEVLGDSVMSFIGPCNVRPEHMIDGEDFLAGSEIRGAKMLHFIIEMFERGIEHAVAYQRLFTLMTLEKLIAKTGEKFERSGDDIYWKGGKLSISIATVSPVSALIHFAMNVNNQDTPVKTCSLDDLKIDPRAFARELGGAFCEELKTIKEACWKVRWAK